METSKRQEAYQSPFPDMDDEQYAKWTALLEERLGVILPEKRKSFLITNVGMRMRELGFKNYDQYYQHLHAGHKGNVEWDQLVHHLTVHETRFLRNRSTLELICNKYLPQKNSQCPSKPLTIHAWSVGCATGEEPYTMAMAIDEHMEQIGCKYYLGITASDISRSALAIGREGKYSDFRVREISPSWRKKYFAECPDGRFEVVKELKQRVCFNQLNILEMDKAPIGYMDIIVCQNLLIYYDRERRMRIMDTLVKYLAPGGILVLAVGEMLNWSHPNVKRFPFANTLAYRRN